ncbi:MAG: PEP-CTERM sorting domain-containing protein [Tepidisphaeraceae bacterium]
MMNSHKSGLLAAAALAALGVSRASANPITLGDLVIYRVGDGSATPLASTGNPVFLDEYTTTGTLVQSIPMPTSAAGAPGGGTQQALIASGTATSEGLLTISANGQYIALTGYDAPTGGSTALPGSAGTTFPRTIGILPVSTGVVDTSTALTDFATGNNPRSAVTTDGNSIWMGGATGGVRYTTIGSTGTSDTQLSTTVTNIRQVNIFGGQLYNTDSSGSTVRLGAVGSGLPTTSGQTITNLPGVPTTGSPYSFFFADLSPTVAGLDTLYVADDTTGTGALGIEKFCLNGGTWTSEGVIAASATFATTQGVRGLTGTYSGSSATLYATTGASAAGGGGQLWSLTDSSGYDSTISGTLNSLVTLSSTSDEAFRGIVYVPEPASASLLLLAGGGLLVRRRRAN